MAECRDDNVVPKMTETDYIIAFVEDFVNYVMSRNCNYVQKSAAIPHFKNIDRKFDQVTEKAVEYLEMLFKSAHHNAFLYMKSQNCVNSNSFMRFADKHAARTLAVEYGTDRVLVYCVELSEIAAHFYKFGILDAPDLAKKYIIDILQKHEMTNGGWDELHAAAKMYAKCLAYESYEHPIQIQLMMSKEIIH